MIRVFAALVLAAFALGGCNTVQGAGKDMSAAGGAVSDSAAKVQSRI
jgi:predicted small secreted protein